MAGVPSKIDTWQMVSPTTYKKDENGKFVVDAPGKLERTTIPVPELGAGDALVEVAGCGVCHTDLSYFYDGVPTVSKPPLTLGHEISGTVVAGPSALVGKNVIVPAVMPCNDCAICAEGRGNRCLAQKMPGNSLGAYGGFASHIPVPAADLCPVENRNLPLEYLAVVADAISTPYQAAVRADLQPGDLVVVIGGTGGVGTYVTQVAAAFGARAVVAADLNAEKLARITEFGDTHTINTAGLSAKEVKEAFKDYCKQAGLPSNYGWKIFEVTGTRAGQEIALDLLPFVGKLIVIGYGMQKVEFMFSRLMALDAEIIGTWGCLPKYYPSVLQLVLDGKIKLEPFVETRPMSRIGEVFEQAHSGRLSRRVVLTPDF